MENDIKKFHLYRKEDISGTSGVGVVAIGVVFPKDGKAVLEWCSGFDTITIFGSVDEMMLIHGHDGRTELIYDL